MRSPAWVVRAVGLPEGFRLYDLRHTCASLLIRQGASIKAVQKHMGHATAAITLDTYGHLFPDELEALAERMDEARAVDRPWWRSAIVLVSDLECCSGGRTRTYNRGLNRAPLCRLSYAGMAG